MFCQKLIVTPNNRWNDGENVQSEVLLKHGQSLPMNNGHEDVNVPRVSSMITEWSHLYLDIEMHDGKRGQ